MIETMFNPPHNATPEEVAAMDSGMTLEEMREFQESLDDDNRLVAIWNLYCRRGDEAAMRATEARFKDQSIVTMNLRYRDIV